MTITDDIFAQLSGAPMQQISQQLGLGQTQTAGAIAAALPMLIGALGRNASQPQGAEALFGALQRDHAGGGMGLGDLLGAVLGGQQSRQTDGAGMLGHIFGSRQPQAEQAIGQATGLGSDKANTLLKVLAPLVLAYLAKRFFDNRQAGAAQQSASPQVLGDLLGQERRQISQQGGLGGGLLAGVLDRDGDGDVDIGDIFNAGMGMMGRR